MCLELVLIVQSNVTALLVTENSRNIVVARQGVMSVKEVSAICCWDLMSAGKTGQACHAKSPIEQ